VAQLVRCALPLGVGRAEREVAVLCHRAAGYRRVPAQHAG
jgi:hypothetical protein